MEGDTKDPPTKVWRQRLVQAVDKANKIFLNGVVEFETGSVIKNPFDVNSSFLNTGCTAGIGVTAEDSRSNMGECRPKTRPGYESDRDRVLEVAYSSDAEEVWKEKESEECT